MSTESLPLHPVIRVLTLADLDRVTEIEEAAYPYPWTRGIFADCIRVGYYCHGLQIGSSLVGYVVQTQAAGECHLLNLCIEPPWQGRGLGSLLLEHAIRLARVWACASMFLEVRPSNQAGIALYLKRGFEIVGHRKEYYRADDGREDAVVMRIGLQGGEDEGRKKTAEDLPDHDPF